MEMDMTKLSEKGQVVIPKEIRETMKLREGMKFLVIGIDNTIILRRMELSEEKLRLRDLLEKSRKKAEQVGFTDEEIDRIIHEQRKGK